MAMMPTRLSLPASCATSCAALALPAASRVAAAVLQYTAVLIAACERRTASKARRRPAVLRQRSRACFPVTQCRPDNLLCAQPPAPERQPA